VPADLRSAGNKYQDFQSAVFLFLFNDNMMQIDLWKKSECISDLGAG